MSVKIMQKLSLLIVFCGDMFVSHWVIGIPIALYIPLQKHLERKLKAEWLLVLQVLL